MATLYRAAFASLGIALFCSAAHADVSISNKPTHDMSCSGGVCTATAKGANLSVSDLTTMLAAGDTTVKTGGGAITIQVVVGFSWTSTSRLTLDANHSVGFHKKVTVAGPGAITIVINDGGSGGDLLFFGDARIGFPDTQIHPDTKRLIINGKVYTLVGNLRSLVDYANGNPAGAYALTADYDAAVDGVYGNPPVSALFSGVFEGLGHTISNLQINSQAGYTGLFANVVGGTIRDLHLRNASVTGEYQNTGGGDFGILAGQVYPGVIANVSVAGSIMVTGDCCRIGGLAGELSGATVVRSSCVCEVDAPSIDDVGGLAGLNYLGTISGSSSAGNISGKSYVGGLVGANVGHIILSSASGSVTGLKKSRVGGLVGDNNQGPISESFAAAAVTGGASSQVGGLIGSNILDKNSGVSVSNVYAIGSATGGSFAVAGGLVGSVPRDYSYIQSAYSTGMVTSSYLAGGVAGQDKGTNTFSNSYWNLDTSGVSDPNHGAGQPLYDPGISGLTDSELKSALPAGFDSNIWGQSPNINNGYPYLLANPPQ